MARHGMVSLAAVAGSLGLGVVGYHYLEGLPWLDALLNASMILGGEGPVDRLHTIAGKVFASAYAIFSGVIFLVAVSFLVAPLAHRLLHRLHLDQESDPGRDSKRR